jgi:hypothetical protein
MIDTGLKGKTVIVTGANPLLNDQEWHRALLTEYSVTSYPC